MLLALLLPILAADPRPRTPVLLAAEFVFGLYLLFFGVTGLRRGRFGSRRELVLTPKDRPKLFWTNVGIGIGGGGIMVAHSLITLWLTQHH
jgi:hypothetical protein